MRGVVLLILHPIQEMMNRYFFIFICVFVLGFSGYSQEGSDPIEDDFNELIETSNDYQGYKVVNYEALTRLRDRTVAHIDELRNEITAQENEANNQTERIEELEAELEATQNDLDRVNAEKDAITFLGMPFSKGSYMALMWGIVGVLVLGLLFFIYKYKNSNATTKEARENLRETEKEFDAYRSKALEKEQRLGRLLQDERNKANN